MNEPATIYIPVQGRGLMMWKSVAATHFEKDMYVINFDNQVPPDEQWPYQPGDMVKCRQARLEDGTEGLIACGEAG